MPEFKVPVQFSGRIVYNIQAPNEAAAKSIADEMAEHENNFGDLENVDWEVKPAIRTT